MKDYWCVVGHWADGKPAMISFSANETPYYACRKHVDCLLTTEQRHKVGVPVGRGT